MSPAALVYWGPSGDSTPLENEQFGIGDDLRWTVQHRTDCLL